MSLSFVLSYVILRNQYGFVGEIGQKLHQREVQLGIRKETFTKLGRGTVGSLSLEGSPDLPCIALSGLF